MPATLEIFESTIIAIGGFNPVIFSPEWFLTNNLIGADDAKCAKDSDSIIISRQIASFETDWFAIQVLESKLTLAVKGAVTPMVKDLAVGILSTIPHTPIQSIGLNFSGHYKFSTVDEYHKIGDALAPKSPWENIFPDRAIGLANLTMKIQPFKRNETPKTGDEINVLVQSSGKIRASGVFFSYNDHKDIAAHKDEGITTAEYAAMVIDNNWDSSQVNAMKTFESLIASALSE